MSIKVFKPTSPGRRGMSGFVFDEITQNKGEKSLLKVKNNSSGRNNTGRVTVRHRGGRHKQKYRVIDFKRNKIGVVGVIKSIEYDPNRTARICLVLYRDGEKRYILAPNKIQVGQEIVSADNTEIKIGNTLPLGNIPIGSTIHNVELKSGKGGQLGRSAGSRLVLFAKEDGYAQIKLNSGEIRKVRLECKATLGEIGNLENSLIKMGKAGRARWRGVRPTVRGVAMNPIDHPLGGGEGKSSGGRHPCTPWGKPTKGASTRNNKRTDSLIISSIGKRG